MKSRPPGPAAHEGKERVRAGIDTSLQGHEPRQFESKSDPDAHPREIFTVGIGAKVCGGSAVSPFLSRLNATHP